jgi:hypothetical protein
LRGISALPPVADVMRGRHLRGARQSLGDLPAILIQMDDAKAQ